MRAVIYARFSSERQSDRSIEDQLEVCRRYIDKQHWQLVRSYEDRAISGARTARQGTRLSWPMPSVDGTTSSWSRRWIASVAGWPMSRPYMTGWNFAA